MTVAPHVCKAAGEYDKVRPLDTRMGLGEKTEMQSRPAVVAIAVVGGAFRLIMPDGRAIEAEREPGRSIDMDAVDHATEDIGTSDAHVALGEFK